LQALANKLLKNLKNPEDLSEFTRLPKKISGEAAPNAKMTHHMADKISPNPAPIT
jgi:hypothetical protein